MNNLYPVQPIMNDDEDEYSIPDSGLEMGDSINSETHDDVDPFEELGIGSRSNPTSTEEKRSQGYDALSDLMAEDDSFELDGFDDEGSNDNSNSEDLYVMLLQTVWVDGILDPAEVRLLAKKREELGISFERHLELVDNVIG